MNKLLRIVIAAAAALALGAWAAYASLEHDLCSWLAPRECGYEAFAYSFFLGCIVAALSFTLILRFMPSIAPAAVATDVGPAPRKLIGLWLALFVLHFAVPLLVTISPHWLFPLLGILDDMTMPLFIITSTMLAPHRGYHPALALLALLPVAGVLMVGALLFLSKPTPLPAK